MAKLLVLQAYEAQTEVVKREKEKLQALNAKLLEARKTCDHFFHNGACEHCFMSREVYERQVLSGVRAPTNVTYRFID